MKIKLFSDMVCPYCYVGKLRLDQAIEKLGLTDTEVEFKAFQLHPTSPADYSMPIYDFIRQAYGPGAVGNPVMRQQVPALSPWRSLCRLFKRPGSCPKSNRRSTWKI